MKSVPPDPNLGQIQLTGFVANGPGDHRIQVFDELQLEPHSEKIFLDGLLGVDFSQKELDLVHTYTVVRMVIDVYQEVLGKVLTWPDQKLYLYPHARTGIGASFSGEENSIKCYSLAVKNKWVYSCQHFDVVAHETGHAVLNALKPEWTKDTGKVTASVIESLCDLTALFTKLYNFDWFRAIQSTDQMQSLSHFALEYGFILGYKNGIRNFTSSSKGITSHDISVVFSGAIFRSLITFSSGNDKLNVEEQYSKTKQLITLCLKAVDRAKGNGANFKQLSHLILSLAKENSWHDWEAILRHHFLNAKIL